jgi:threonine dehydrogenase-like Zn-dependent dehydrogenase
MAKTSRAMVQLGPRQLEMREFPLPEISSDAGLLKIEVCGICGSDWCQYQGEFDRPEGEKDTAIGSRFRVRYPLVPGHEPVGIIEKIGADAARRWKVKEGDRICVEPALPCGFCEYCIQGMYKLCSGKDSFSCYSFMPISTPPTALWGGYADYMYLDPHSVIHKIDSKIPADLAALYNPLGAGIFWAAHHSGLRLGDTIVILGCGQRGLACVIAAKAAGASCIVVTGLEIDQPKLALAREFGADFTIIADKQDPVDEVRKIMPRGADIVLDTTPKATISVNHAIDMVTPGGTVGLAGTKGKARVSDLRSDLIDQKDIRVIGMKGASWRANEAAIRLIESGRLALGKLHTHTVPLEEAERALNLLGGRVPGETAVHITLKP